MKQVYTLLILLLVVGVLSSHAQVGVNTDGSLPDPSAMLDIKSTTRGFLVPRVTSALRLAFSSPADGLLVYDTDTESFWYYKNGTGWTQLTVGGSGSLSLPYSATVNSASTLFSLINPGTGMAMSVTSTGATGVYGATSTLSGAGLLADNLAGGEAATGRTASVSGT